MNGSIKIIGTNEITRHLQDQVFENSTLEAKGFIHDLSLNEKKYLFDSKEIRVEEDHLLFIGQISDDTNWVGNIAFKFYPEKNLDFFD